MEIKIPKEYKNRFLKKDNFKFNNSQLVLLWGGNGVGKSCLLELMSKQDNTYYWVASKDAPLRNPNEVGLDNILNFSLLYDSKYSSEGQNITDTFYKHLNKVPNNIKYLLIDELDSGLSAEHVQVCANMLLEWLGKHKDTQCFVSINNYHWIHMFKTIYRMDIGEFQTINDYDEYWKILVEIFYKK